MTNDCMVNLLDAIRTTASAHEHKPEAAIQGPGRALRVNIILKQSETLNISAAIARDSVFVYRSTRGQRSLFPSSLGSCCFQPLLLVAR